MDEEELIEEYGEGYYWARFRNRYTGDITDPRLIQVDIQQWTDGSYSYLVWMIDSGHTVDHEKIVEIIETVEYPEEEAE